MNGDTALARLSDANPIPDAHAYADDMIAARRLDSSAFLVATRERDQMTKTEEHLTTDLTRRRARPWWQPALAAALVVIVAIVAAVAISNAGEDAVEVPAPPFETPEDAAVAYVANVNGEGGWESYLAMTTEDASNDHLGTYQRPTPEKVQARHQSLAGEGFAMEIVDCPPLDGITTICKARLTNGWSSVLHGGDFFITMLVRISDGGFIERVGFAADQAGSELEEDLAEWMTITHPTLADEQYNQLWGGADLSRSPEQIAADYLEAVREFVESQ